MAQIPSEEPKASRKKFEEELAELDQTLDLAALADVSALKEAIRAASQQSIIAIGSGGSFTTATMLAALHESFTGRVSRAATPLELICNPNIASTSPIFLVSAEGKNPDALEVLRRSRRNSSRTIHVLTNRCHSPLTELAEALSDVSIHAFELPTKDGYLATNSLVLDAALIGRIYNELDDHPQELTSNIGSFRISGTPMTTWAQSLHDFGAAAARSKGLIVVFSPLLRSIAIDLESKLSESALAFCQIADFRSFAHGRHLWLTQRPEDCALVVISEPSVAGLWESMRPAVPDIIPTCVLHLDGAGPGDMVGGLAAQMHLVAAIAKGTSREIAQPNVRSASRSLYYADLPVLVQPHTDAPFLPGEQSKYEVLGSFWPQPHRSGPVQRARRSFRATIHAKPFRAIVFDYDGTLSSSNRRDLPPSQEILEQLSRLATEGVRIGVASGRGTTIQKHLLASIDPSLHAAFYLGLYNGGWTAPLTTPVTPPETPSEFLLHCKRVVEGLRQTGVPIDNTKLTNPYQLSIRFSQGVGTESMWYVIVDALRHVGLGSSTVVRSKHSVDVMSKGVSKSNLISEMINALSIQPYDILTMGDMGSWPGNDYSLLEHKYSLSVDTPSRRLDRAWKFAPHYLRDVDATRWYLANTVFPGDGTVRFLFEDSETDEGH